MNEIRLEGQPTFGKDGSVFVNNVQVASLGIFRLENPQKIGRIQSKVKSVEEKIGREIKKVG